MSFSTLSLGGTTPASAADDAMWDAFRTPPSEAKVFRIEHGWPADKQQVDGRINTAQDMGFGGYVSSLPFGDDYAVADDNFNTLNYAVKTLKDKGMLAWFYDENGYPSGRAGKLVLQGHPELDAQCLNTLDIKLSGGDNKIVLPPGKLLSATAYQNKELIDLTAMRSAGDLSFKLPQGNWRVIVITQDTLFVGTQVEGNAYPNGSHYIDILNPASTTRFIEITHDEVAKHLGQDMGKLFVSTFTDEPSTLAMFFTRKEYGVLPWSCVMLKEFQKRRGYDLAPKLSALVADVLPDTAKVRCDYYKTIAELSAEYFLEPIRKWAKAHNTLSGGHALLEENVVHHAPLYGDLFTWLQQLDAPGIDVLSCDPKIKRSGTLMAMDSHVPYDAARFASSVAQLDGSRNVMCEISDFHQQMNGDVVLSGEHLRGAYNRMLWGGITAFNTYSGFNKHDPQVIKGLLQYTARVNSVLYDGSRVADVAVLYPIESVWAHFTPSKQYTNDVTPDCASIGYVQRDVTRSLFEDMRDYDYLHSNSLAKATIKNGELVVGKSSYRAIVLPAVDTIPKAAWTNLVKYWKAGGRILFVGKKPLNTTEAFPAPGIANQVEAMLKDASGHVKFLTEADALETSKIIDQWLSPQLKASDATNLRMTHRRKDGYDIYFVMNENDAAWNGQIELTGKQAEIWEPLTGTRTTLTGLTTNAKLDPWAGLILRMKSAKRSHTL